jgi:hypothetical protein
MFVDQYILDWAPSSSDQLIGQVFRPTPAGFLPLSPIPIVRSDEELARVGMRFITTSEEGSKPIIMVTREFLSLDRDQREVLVWHEVGHVHHEHLHIHRGKTRAEFSRYRKGMIQRGKVIPEEIEADRFAADRVGASRVCKSLKKLLASRISGEPSGLKSLGAAELQLRIAALEGG